MCLIASYAVEDEGYHPFLIGEDWQVARLNYSDEQHLGQLNKIEVHWLTDEIFVVLKGKAALIAARFTNEVPVFEVELMKPGVTYNIPKNTWHTIAMEKGSEVLIFEKSNTHLTDVDYYLLERHQLTELKFKVEQLLKDQV